MVLQAATGITRSRGRDNRMLLGGACRAEIQTVGSAAAKRIVVVSNTNLITPLSAINSRIVLRASTVSTSFMMI